jgi:uncharacterized protein YjbI with pentapeptide repeats
VVRRPPRSPERGRSADRTPAHILRQPTLFIDDTSAPVLGNCILQPYTDCSGADLQGANLTNDNLTDTNFNG